MIITILAEPRSGSSNLTNWFDFQKNFTTLFIPRNPKSEWHNLEPSKKYKYKTKHLLIKNDYYTNIDFSELLEISDKIILLYRENYQEQIESWINAKLTNNWGRQWVSKDTKNDDETDYFTELKSSFKKEYLDKDYFKISYEELYYNNEFQKILDYLDITDLENKNFPVGQKYRVNTKVNKLI